MTIEEAVAEMEAGGFGGALRHSEPGQWVVWREGEMVFSRNLA